MRIGRPGRFSSTIIAAAATRRDTSVGMATPSTPMWRPKIKMALPDTLMMFISRETHMEILELPMTRNSAAPALYSARKGMDASTMR